MIESGNLEIRQPSRPLGGMQTWHFFLHFSCSCRQLQQDIVWTGGQQFHAGRLQHLLLSSLVADAGAAIEGRRNVVGLQFDLFFYSIVVMRYTATRSARRDPPQRGNPFIVARRSLGGHPQRAPREYARAVESETAQRGFRPVGVAGAA
jgi:hypothetical protein